MARVTQLDLANLTIREVNQFLHHELDASQTAQVDIQNPDGKHSIAAGLDVDVTVNILGHAGYFVAGMNKQASVTIHGNVGWSVAENIMSGTVRVTGHASQCTAASGHGGLVVIEGNASSRCGISMKGCDIVVQGNVGHFAGFMAQAGRLVVCGDAGPHLGDSLYEAILYVRGSIASLGADAQQEEMTPDDIQSISELLTASAVAADPHEFKKVASARRLYHWNATERQEY